MNRIKILREENNWSQNELAIKINCSASSIAMYEKEDRKPSLEVLIVLSQVFGVSIDYLLCQSDIRNCKSIDDDFMKMYHKETEGLSKQEISDAIRIYKEIKYSKK